MRIAVVGVGAMGSVYAALLADAGNDVVAIDTDATQIAAIREHGLRVEGASGDRVIRLRAETDTAEVGTVDLVVLATKALHVRAASENARALLGPDTVVLSIQNGIGSADVAAEAVGEDRVIVGIAGGFGASVVEPGRAHHHGLEVVRLGERSGPATPRLERVAETWRLAGFRVETLDDVERLVWEKLICNVAYSGVCTVLDLTIGEVLDNPHARELSAACAQEAWTVARASGIAVEIDDPVAYVRAFGKKIRGARPSMLLDRHAGRRTEIDAINGAIPPRAEAVGLTAPVNAVISALVRALEA